MSTETPAPDAETHVAPISELLSSQPAADDAHREVGAPEPDAAPTQSAQPAPTAEIAPAVPAAKPEAEQPFWYRKESEKLRKRAQAAERELERIRGQPPQHAQPQLSDEDLDRPLTRRELEAFHSRSQLVQRLETSEERFIDKLGDETFEQTREWLTTRPDIEEWALKQRDPWKAAHSQFQKERLAAEIGEDPNAWRVRERELMRQEILAEQQREATPAPAAAPQMRSAPPLPASTARSAPPSRDAGGRFAGPAPIGQLSKHRF